MLLTLTTTHRPATDLGFLLMKNPDNVHEAELAFGRATIFYPEATEERCTAALTVEVDPVELVRAKGRKTAIEDHYVSDRPYAASSLLSVAIGRAFGTAMGGRSTHRPELAGEAIPLEATVTPLPARGGADLVARLFEPLGYEVILDEIPLDQAHPDWGRALMSRSPCAGSVASASCSPICSCSSPCSTMPSIIMSARTRSQKLLRKGEGWLERHPERELIVRRYLQNHRALVRLAMAGLEERIEPEEAEARSRARRRRGSDREANPAQ